MRSGLHVLSGVLLVVAGWVLAGSPGERHTRGIAQTELPSSSNVSVIARSRPNNVLRTADVTSGNICSDGGCSAPVAEETKRKAKDKVPELPENGDSGILQSSADSLLEEHVLADIVRDLPVTPRDGHHSRDDRQEQRHAIYTRPTLPEAASGDSRHRLQLLTEAVDARSTLATPAVSPLEDRLRVRLTESIEQTLDDLEERTPSGDSNTEPSIGIPPTAGAGDLTPVNGSKVALEYTNHVSVHYNATEDTPRSLRRQIIVENGTRVQFSSSYIHSEKLGADNAKADQDPGEASVSEHEQQPEPEAEQSSIAGMNVTATPTEIHNRRPAPSIVGKSNRNHLSSAPHPRRVTPSMGSPQWVTRRSNQSTINETESSTLAPTVATAGNRTRSRMIGSSHLVRNASNSVEDRSSSQPIANLRISDIARKKQSATYSWRPTNDLPMVQVRISAVQPRGEQPPNRTEDEDKQRTVMLLDRGALYPMTTISTDSKQPLGKSKNRGSLKFSGFKLTGSSTNTSTQEFVIPPTAVAWALASLRDTPEGAHLEQRPSTDSEEGGGVSTTMRMTTATDSEEGVVGSTTTEFTDIHYVNIGGLSADDDPVSVPPSTTTEMADDMVKVGLITVPGAFRKADREVDERQTSLPTEEPGPGAGDEDGDGDSVTSSTEVVPTSTTDITVTSIVTTTDSIGFSTTEESTSDEVLRPGTITGTTSIPMGEVTTTSPPSEEVTAVPAAEDSDEDRDDLLVTRSPPLSSTDGHIMEDGEDVEGDEEGDYVHHVDSDSREELVTEAAGSAGNTYTSTTMSTVTTAVNVSAASSRGEVAAYLRLIIRSSWDQLCRQRTELRRAFARLLSEDTSRDLSEDSFQLVNVGLQQCKDKEKTVAVAENDEDPLITVDMVVFNEDGVFERELNERMCELLNAGNHTLPLPVQNVQIMHSPLPTISKPSNAGVIAAVTISCVGAVCLLLLAILLIVMRRRQKRFTYGQRCTPVSLDAYSLDSVSVCNSVRRKGLRASKRSYGNPAFDDPGAPSHPMNFAGLANFSSDRDALEEEFAMVPQVTPKSDELPPGAEMKNRYSNVIPLPETRVQLLQIDGEPLSDYINANYVRGPKNEARFYIACQGPLQSTVTDFWRMVWEQQSKVILMLTDLVENGVEKCADYLPPSEVLDCHRLFGDFQITLKKREERDKYVISTLQLKNLETNSWREVTHLWFLSWPHQGVPDEANSIIAFVIEARPFMRANTGPTIVHCSPGTGRTGTVLACDICIREFEQSRMVDIPRCVYRLRRDRGGAVKTKEQYMFIYQVLNMYATKLTGGGGLDSI